jgi:Rab3 GTPase-activating protein regulatory subunit N-terminus
MNSTQNGSDATLCNEYPNQQKPSESQYYNCSALLKFASNAEADCMVCVNRIHRLHSGQYNDSDVNNPQVSFGHPEPPKLIMHHLFPPNESFPDNEHSIDSIDCVIVVAYTKHTVSVQLIRNERCQRYQSSSNKSSCQLAPPLEVCILVPGDGPDDAYTDSNLALDEEQITCLALVRLDDVELLKTHSASNSNQEVDYNAETNDDDETEQHRLAVVFGTNQNRLYTVELKVTKTVLNTSASRDHQPQWNIIRVSVSNDSCIESSLFQVLPTSASPNHSFDRIRSTTDSFSPAGGIQGVRPFRVLDKQRTWDKYATTSVYLWVAFGDGRVVRLHSACLFPSVWKLGADIGKSVEEFINTKLSKRIDASIVNAIIQLPFELFETISTIPQIVPLPQYHISPLGVIPLSVLNNLGNMEVDDESIRLSTPTMEALVLAQGGPSDTFPTFCFYVSEDQYFRTETDMIETSEKALSTESNSVITSVGKALFGSAVGALRWGFGGTTNITSTSNPVDSLNQINTTTTSRHGPFRDNDTTKGEDTSDDGSTKLPASTPFPSLFQEPVYLYAGIELHDAPRQIESCSVEPDGSLAAACDSLGRVLLIDLESKQVVRIWKGYRESRCYWHHAIEPKTTGFALHLVIHSQQRRLVEVWKVRHGRRVLSKQVGRDATVVSCITSCWSKAEIATCYVMHSVVHGSSQPYLEKIQWDPVQPASQPFDQILEDRRQPTKSNLQRQSSDASVVSVRSSTLKIQHLQQLLSSTTVAFSREDVERSLMEIKSLTDLSTALDLLATSSILESRLGISDASFHVTVVSYCAEILKKSIRRLGEDPENSSASSNTHVRLLSFKIKYYTQVRFENFYS